MSKRNICKEQKVPELSLAQITTLEEPKDGATAAKTKESKHIKHTLSSPSTSFAAETTIWEQEVKVTKNQKHSKDQEASSYLPLPPDPGETQPQGANAPHASKPLSAAPFREATAQSAAPGTPMLKEAAVAMMTKRKISKEQKLPDLSLAQNTSLEEQRDDAVEAKMKKESKNMEHTLPSCSTSVAAETTIWKQELKVTKKQKQRKQQEPSRKSPLQLDPGHTHCVRSQGGKAPPEQEREAGGRMGSSIKINNGKRPRVLSKRELIKEASKKKPVLPEGFVPFTDFASSCTEQNRDHSSAYSAFFDQFRYNPVLEDHKPPLLRTPDRVARLPSRGHSSLESSPLTANETSRAAKFNTSVASKGKQLESGSGSQEKLNLDVKENTQKKKREKKQREPSGNTLPFDPSQTCCIQLHKAPPEQYQGADAPKVDNVKNGNCKKAHVCAPSKRKLFKEMNKEQVLPEGFLAPSDFGPNCTEQSPNYTSPSAASLYQFCYRPACQDRNPQPPGTTDRLSMMPPRGYPSFVLSELFANGTSKASKANNSLARKLKKKDSGSGSSYGSQEKLHAKEKKNPKKKMGTTKQREPPPLLTPAEKCSDKYRRVSLDQLVPPPRSPHNLLQEEYASDPWKVIVIRMLLNLTHGKQVKNIIEGFFECYPDAQSAVNADPEKMAGYLAYLGLQRVKTTRIQKFSKEYVEKEWTYITELCGVGKYAADAYAIFCAGRATEVVPKDHKLVDYWKYVCFELPMMQESKTCRKLQ
ncbi:hypothetical protein QYE76_068840 [Lolium multiflorum]|uniref:HhH-GPD domain-containing protein n=1 Tax=Lolium multiflorum TaxID=4521 RepID=A0AAD8WCZ3_LOLMU|nr:hypothetical protein QYE76_068840 [Lolium multiflorum]